MTHPKAAESISSSSASRFVPDQQVEGGGQADESTNDCPSNGTAADVKVGPPSRG